MQTKLSHCSIYHILPFVLSFIILDKISFPSSVPIYLIHGSDVRTIPRVILSDGDEARKFLTVNKTGDRDVEVQGLDIAHNSYEVYLRIDQVSGSNYTMCHVQDDYCAQLAKSMQLHWLVSVLKNTGIAT